MQTLFTVRRAARALYIVLFLYVLHFIWHHHQVFERNAQYDNDRPLDTNVRIDASYIRERQHELAFLLRLNASDAATYNPHLGQETVIDDGNSKQEDPGTFFHRDPLSDSDNASDVTVDFLPLWNCPSGAPWVIPRRKNETDMQLELHFKSALSPICADHHLQDSFRLELDSRQA